MSDADRSDYAAALRDLGVSHAYARAVSEDMADATGLPAGLPVAIDRSPIEGVGVFVSRHVEAGEVLGPARIGWQRTPLGRFTNHGATPNARMVLLPNGDLDLVAARDIEAGEEATIDYRLGGQIAERTREIVGRTDEPSPLEAYFRASQDEYEPEVIAAVVEAALMADDIDEVEEALLHLPRQDTVTHHFGPGIYIREMTVPAGTFVIGHAHRGPCTNILLKGRMILRTPDGDLREVAAPLLMTTGPGRKVAFALEETVWQNVWATDETDIGKLEEMLVEKSPAFRRMEAACLLQQ